MPSPIVGLHHITAIASDPQRTLDFYTQTLGLRFVKRTVNFDDPGTYHFYFGDDLGSPGTILTFFPWPHATRGYSGTVGVAFEVPLDSFPFWKDRLKNEGVPFEEGAKRFSDSVLVFVDPDGMKIELIGQQSSVALHNPRFSPVPAEHALRGFFGATLLEQTSAPTASVLELLGFRLTGIEGNRRRYTAPGSSLGRHVDVVFELNGRTGVFGAGSVHHIAFRAPDDKAQLEWREEIPRIVDVTPVLDRTYFHSIYFREPGGVLFELATDPPGFAYDEPLESLGEALRVPVWLESKRSLLEQRLPPISLKKSTASLTAPPSDREGQE